MSDEAPKSPRRGVGQRAFYEIARAVLALTAAALLRYRRFGLHNMPLRGGCLLVANHQSFLDPPLIGLCVYNRQFHPMARGGLFNSRLLAPLIRALNALPVGQGVSETAAMKRAVELLRRGEVVLIFPEGSRSPDGALQPFKRGAGVLIKRARCPVVPVAIEGAHDAWPRGGRLRLWGSRVGVEVGEPIPHEQLLRDGPDEALSRLEHEVESLRKRLHGRLRAAAGRQTPPRRITQPRRAVAS